MYNYVFSIGLIEKYDNDKLHKKAYIINSDRTTAKYLFLSVQNLVVYCII